MHHNLAAVARTARNADFAALCNLLSFMEPGDEIDVTNVATILQIEPTFVAFMLDTLVEMGALLNDPEDDGVALAA